MTCPCMSLESLSWSISFDELANGEDYAFRNIFRSQYAALVQTKGIVEDAESVARHTSTSYYSSLRYKLYLAGQCKGAEASS